MDFSQHPKVLVQSELRGRRCHFALIVARITVGAGAIAALLLFDFVGVDIGEHFVGEHWHGNCILIYIF
jgi:hypothetical protein